MAASVHVDIITPESTKFAGAADSIQLPTVDGEIGILKDHNALVTMLAAGTAKIHIGSAIQEVVVGEGFATVLGNRITCLVDSAVNREDIRVGEIDGRVAELERSRDSSGRLSGSLQAEFDYLRAQQRAVATK
jgi:F-type H+-transporting ATPase subunit epsilon